MKKYWKQAVRLIMVLGAIIGLFIFTTKGIGVIMALKIWGLAIILTIVFVIGLNFIVSNIKNT